MQSMSRCASFTCTALMGTNKSGVLKPNAAGYYTVVLGALNIYNSAGAYWPLATAKEIFKESSSFMRRIANGALRGEYGHPRQQPGMSQRDFFGRIMDIYEPNVSHHIRKVWVDYDTVKDESGRPVITIMGEVIPAGPMGPALKASLENPSENVCFSIRSITDDRTEMGVIQKNIRTIVTWDYVNEPGLKPATKWKAPTLEAFSDVRVSPEQLKGLARQRRLAGAGTGMESSCISVESVMEDLGWGDKLTLPPTAKW